jgi:phosphoribosylglycinamide formyltransferase-1
LKNIVVFASGSGTNFQAIIDSVKSGKINANISGLIASKPDIGATGRAERAGVPVAVIPPGSESFKRDLEDQLREWQPDLIVLAGYLAKIPKNILNKYSGKIINIHPSLLPKYGGSGFYGSRVHQAVIRSGDIETGCTVHIVTEEYDQGPVLAQKKVPVPGDTAADLAIRVLKEEHKLLTEVISQIINN